MTRPPRGTMGALHSPRAVLHLATLVMLVMGSVRGQQYVATDSYTAAPPSSPVVVRRAEPTAPIHCDARFEGHMGGGQFASGSAVVAGTGPGVTYLLTNNHNVQGISAAIVTIGGQRYPAQTVATDTANDLAVLRISGNLPYVGVASQMPPIGSVLTCRSFDCGAYCVRWTGTYKGHNHEGAGLLETYAVGGNSGGGVYYNGNLVGIMWGNSADNLAFAPVAALRAILTRAGCTPVESPSTNAQGCYRLSNGQWVCQQQPQYYQPQPQVRYQQPPRQTQPPQSMQQPVPVYDPPQPTDPGPATSATPPPRSVVDLPPCNCDENWKTLNARIDARIEAKSPFPTATILESIKAHEARLEQLEAKVEVALAQSGTPGERGPAGPQGPQGPAGKDATLDPALQNRISQLEAELVALKDRKIRLELHKDGELIGVSEGTHTVRVNINELEK